MWDTVAELFVRFRHTAAKTEDHFCGQVGDPERPNDNYEKLFLPDRHSIDFKRIYMEMASFGTRLERFAVRRCPIRALQPA